MRGAFWINNVQIRNPDGSLITSKSDHSPAVALCDNALLIVYKAENSNDLCFAEMSVDKNQQEQWHAGRTISSLTNGLVAPKSDVSPASRSSGTRSSPYTRARVPTTHPP
jgi:hypothetical protein